MDEYILELDHITKIFPGVKALQDVNFQLKRGEIHALMGENGAGKSTFIKVITGVHQPEEGTMKLDGQPVAYTELVCASGAGLDLYEPDNWWDRLWSALRGHAEYGFGARLV